ncbi:MAG: hypothetical protein J6B31_00685 [Bacteroidaceae bacterium]|nr:hypothetical protein [Bacteroidaceae bacterium]
MERKYKDIPTSNELSANEPTMAYQRRSGSGEGVTRMMTQKELETECFSLEDSKNRLIEKIHRHYHRQA